MALALLALQQRSPTRMRLLFDGPVGSGGFGVAALTIYSASESYDGSNDPARVWLVVQGGKMVAGNRGRNASSTPGPAAT